VSFVSLSVTFRDYADGKVHRIEGIFPLSNPWWSATLFLSGTSKKSAVGCQSFKLRSDELMTEENITWLFVMACMKNDNYRQHTDAFHRALRWHRTVLLFALLPHRGLWEHSIVCWWQVLTHHTLSAFT